MGSPSASKQAFYIDLFNRLGAQLERTGLRVPDISDRHLMKLAERRTGLSDFGDDTFRAGLARLTSELQDHARLSQIGRLAARFNLVDNLCVRLELIDYRKRRPEVARQQIQRPLFITGLPRTGTTILFELIAQDPAMRSPASWEVARPVPPAQINSYLDDRRIRSVNRFMGLAEKLSPGFQAIHAIGAQLPQECVYMFASQFTSEQFGYMFNIPNYRAWALAEDMTNTYRWHARFLQHMQVDYAGEHWVLKTPSHLAYLKYLFAQYPDAAIVWTHRRPLDAVASFSSLATHLQGAFSGHVDPLEVGAHELAHFARTVEAGMEQRRSLDPARFFDVSFEAICSNPIAVIADIYEYFGMRLNPEAESRMRTYLDHHPRNLYGVHRYSPADFGLDEAQERCQYAEYLARYSGYLN